MFLEDVTVSPSTDDEASARDRIGRLTGEVIKTTQQAIRQGFLDWSPRLLLAMYSCEIQASSMRAAPPPLFLVFSPSSPPSLITTASQPKSSGECTTS